MANVDQQSTADVPNGPSDETSVDDSFDNFDSNEPTPVEIPPESSERRAPSIEAAARGLAGMPTLAGAIREANDKVMTAPGQAPVALTVMLPANYVGALRALGITGLYGATAETAASVILMEGTRDAIAKFGVRPGPPPEPRIVTPGMPPHRGRR